LGSLDAEVFHQHGIQFVCMPGGFPQPTQDGVFLDPFDPRQCADAIAFCQERQHFQDFMLLSMFAEENGSGGFREGLAASLTLVALCPAGRFADLFKVRLSLIALQLSKIWTSCVWTKIFGSGKFFHFVSLGIDLHRSYPKKH
jgi:hypothetical protein